ncbi:Elongation factor 1-beta 1 [Euphorbia peplus]|nr:Elongation factor 1-beta 1 [Euphorbia peplus]
MAITFSDLHTEAGVKSLDEFLAGKSYISGDQLTKDDIKVYAAVSAKPGASFPNASKCFPGKAVGVQIVGAKADAHAPPKEIERDMETWNEGITQLHPWLVIQDASDRSNTFSYICL